MKKLSWTFALIIAFPACVQATESVDYSRQVKPVLQARCYACHGALKQKAGLRLDTAALAIKGGKKTDVIKPGEPDDSSILDRITSTSDGERMPPDGEPLTKPQIDAIRAWILQGAKSPANESPERDPREHWAFQRPVRPPVPEVVHKELIKNPIDAFLVSEQEKRGLVPQGPADKRVLLRRLTIDLTGLPPSSAEIEAFVADTSPKAYEKVVERLLASPQYGERWGRHWMDIWRYSDWWGLGAEVRNSQKHIWHWRDWIIESLNADKGYDQMLREMLAADELYPDDLDKLRATGFLARQYFKFNRTSWLDETIQHTSKAMLGLTFNCAKCHDHKYDPISQADYYRFRAIFEPYQVRTDAVPGELDFEKDGIPRAFDCNLDIKTYIHVRGDDRNPDLSRVMEPALPAFLLDRSWKIEPVKLSPTAANPGLRPFVQESSLKNAEQRRTTAAKAMEQARSSLEKIRKEKGKSEAAQQASVAAAEVAGKEFRAADLDLILVRVRILADRARNQSPGLSQTNELVRMAVDVERLAKLAQAELELARTEKSLIEAVAAKKADATKKRDAAKAALDTLIAGATKPASDYNPIVGSLKTLENNLETEESRRKPFPTTSTGRRSALARWITDPNHPLPARVAVNHVWTRHFGRPLVPTVFDFGRKGAQPTHPQLLDWLAVELVEHGWSLKHIHLLIVLSAAYQRSSSNHGAAAVNLAKDAENVYYWRANPIRMEAQVIRDSLLALSGELDLKIGGPPVPVADDSSKRRSLYYVHTHNEHQQFLETFDDAGVLECYRRAESIVPQQALALENSPLTSRAAEKIAERISAMKGVVSDRDFVRQAFVTMLATEPNDAELAITSEALARFRTMSNRPGIANPQARARSRIIQALANHNDFLTVR